MNEYGNVMNHVRFKAEVPQELELHLLALRPQPPQAGANGGGQNASIADTRGHRQGTRSGKGRGCFTQIGFVVPALN